MKPPVFDYHAPRSLEEALELLAEHEDAKPLAGGQSLVPAMNFRLAQPAVLVDLNFIPELSYLRTEPGGGLAIGTMTRQRAAERSALVAERAPLLTETLPWVAHPQIRNRGTIGGSLAHADPAAELPAAVLALEARFRLRRRGSERTLVASELFTGLFSTAIEPGELLVEIELPAPPPRSGTAFREVARRHGDFALAGVAAQVVLGTDGRCEQARLGLVGVGDGPTRASEAEAVLRGETPSLDLFQTAATATAAALDPPGDLHASAAYRRHLVEMLTRQALELAFARAGNTL